MISLLCHSRKSYVWSTLGITASTFNLGAVAFWMPTFLTRIRVFLGVQSPCTQGSCPTSDRCRITFPIPPYTSFLITTFWAHFAASSRAVLHSELWRWWRGFLAGVAALCCPGCLGTRFRTWTRSSAQQACWDRSPASWSPSSWHQQASLPLT